MLVASHLLIFDERGRVLQLRRFNTGYEDGKWSVPAGHVDRGESADAAAIREAHEELGIIVSGDDLRFVHVMHRSDPRDGDERVDFFFVADRWEGTIENREPHKCDALDWFELTGPAAETVDYVRAAFEAIACEEPFSTQGWIASDD